MANEAEISNTDKEDYLRRREKLIGKTLQVQSEFGKAFDYFASMIDGVSSKQFLVAQKNEILSLCIHFLKWTIFGYCSETMWDFERVFECLDTMHRNNHAAMTALLRLWLPPIV